MHCRWIRAACNGKHTNTTTQQLHELRSAPDCPQVCYCLRCSRHLPLGCRKTVRLTFAVLRTDFIALCVRDQSRKLFCSSWCCLARAGTNPCKSSGTDAHHAFHFLSVGHGDNKGTLRARTSPSSMRRRVGWYRAELWAISLRIWKCVSFISKTDGCTAQ